MTADQKGLAAVKKILHDRYHESVTDGCVFAVDMPAEKVWEFVGIMADVRQTMHEDLSLRIILTTKDEATTLIRFGARMVLMHDGHEDCGIGADIELTDDRKR